MICSWYWHEKEANQKYTKVGSNSDFFVIGIRKVLEDLIPWF